MQHARLWPILWPHLATDLKRPLPAIPRFVMSTPPALIVVLAVAKAAHEVVAAEGAAQGCETAMLGHADGGSGDAAKVAVVVGRHGQGRSRSRRRLSGSET
jgi:hypothetical protein